MSAPFRILIIDDDRISALYLGKFLSMRGCETKIVTDSTEALDQLRQFKPQAVTVDGSMPGVSGSEVAQQIRQEPGYERIPIVAVSAYDNETYAATSKNAGIDHHLQKPADIDEPCRILEIGRRLSPRERADLEGQLASLKAKINSPSLTPEEWLTLDQERQALEQKLLEDGR